MWYSETLWFQKRYLYLEIKIRRRNLEIPLIYFTSSDDGIAGCSIGPNGATGCGSDIFTTDGTLSGTNILLEINGDIGYLSVHSGILYFTQDHTINAIVLY